jgi:cytochrome P450
MGISETILAAGIGGAATITAALFQLYTALRVKPKTDARPKKTSMLRSYVAIAVLMVASAAGGYVFAELRQQQAIADARATHEELRGMRDEINAELRALQQTAEHLARERRADDEPDADAETLVLARGPVDRACSEAGSDVSACDAIREAAPATPADPPVAADGAR